MSFSRFLLRFSYLGTTMKGAQKTNPNSDAGLTVQGNLEMALRRFNYIERSFVISSRTDAGVHALNNAAHVDLRAIKSFPDKLKVLSYMNSFYARTEKSIVVNDFVRVPNTFSARRSAIQRTYLYRMAVVKKEFLGSYPKLPIEEWRRILCIRSEEFDIDRFKACCKLFEGMHDFGTFKKAVNNQPWKSSIRVIKSVEVTPGIPMFTSYNNSLSEAFDFWDIKVVSRSFVYNQIRRMVGTAVAVANNDIPISEVKTMLTVPSKLSWNTKINVVIPNALYLCNVEYPKEAFMFDESTTTDKEDSTTDDDEEEEEYLERIEAA